EYLPEASRKVTDFESGRDMGRIYRVVAANAPPKKPKKFDLSKSSVKELVAEFNNPNIWWRMTAQRLLLERHDSKAVPYLAALCANGKAPEARIHALRTLEALGALSDEQTERALADQ